MIDRKEVKTSAEVVTDFTLLLIPHIHVAVCRLPTVRTVHFVILRFAHSQSIFRHPSVKSTTNIKQELLRTSVAVWYNKMCAAKRVASDCEHINMQDNNPRNVATNKC